MGETALWGKPPYGGNRPQRGIRKGYYGGNRPMGEPAPNAVLEKAIMGETALWGNPPPTRVIVKAIEKAVAGYCDTYYIFIIPL